MATFTSSFKTLPKRADLQALAFPDGKPYMPFTDPVHRPLFSSYELQYLDSLLRILEEGHVKSSRPGQHTLMLDDVQFSIDLTNHQLPLLTSRYVPSKSFIVETIWFISGSTDIEFLKKYDVTIWDDWVLPKTAKFEPTKAFKANEMINWVRCYFGTDIYKNWRSWQAAKNIGRATVEQVQEWWKENEGFGLGMTAIPMARMVSGSIGEGAYGYQWRRRTDTRIIDGSKEAEFADTHPEYTAGIRSSYSDEAVAYTAGFDQLAEVIRMLRETPDSRRIILDAWDPSRVKDCALPPCHPWVQFTSHVNEDTQARELTVKLTMRSSDSALGTPANVFQYALLANLVASVTGHKATKLVFSSGDYHLYEDQLPFVTEQLTRMPIPPSAYLALNNEIEEIDEFTVEDILVKAYDRSEVHPGIPYPVAV